MMNKRTYIKTVDEAQKYIGKIIVCYYYSDYQKEMNVEKELFDPDNENRKIAYMWMFKLTKIKPKTPLDPQNIRQAELYGINAIRLVEYEWDTNKVNNTPTLTRHNESFSTAQHYVRLATPQEIKIYLKLNRKYRIYGNY